ncbi:probable multidrug resistance-associated protein lethal(2)03659 isoform X2 [Leptidea sinapis]|uniref:probable multidrug resistance-associated protein lethal(2)03659 isoform X2 n=1 Tax=Leptidea sinapis TaxID=189913 RepID=UPI0021C46D5B|nr:probable multidrug resistance-associated protein lethal(2)03659 isoform X2 [Leptidea sinapis]
MDTGPKQRRKRNPRCDANLFSILTFGWTLETFRLGYSRDIKENDLYAPLPEHQSNVLGDAMQKSWNQEVSCIIKRSDGSTPRLWRVLCKVFGAELLLYGLILAAMEFLIRLQQPLFLGLLLKYYSPSQDFYNTTSTSTYLSRLYSYYDISTDISWGEAVFFSFGVVFCSMFNIMIQHPFMMGAMHIGMKIRVGICSLIYRKALKVSLQSMSESRGGLIVNLLANDVNRFDTGPLFVHYLWIGPLETIFMSVYLYREMGMSALYGVCVVFAVVPFQVFLGTRTAYYRRMTAEKSDERVRNMEEIVIGVEVIKMYTWEKPFRKLIDTVRRQEIHFIKMTSYIRGIILSFIMFTSRFSIFITIIVYVTYMSKITVENVFFLTCYYNIMKQTMTLYFPQAVGQVAEMLVAIERINEFLLSEECRLPLREQTGEMIKRAKQKKRVRISYVNKEDSVISFEEASCRWLKTSSSDDVSNINLNINSATLTMIIGAVGSGKSTLLLMMLNELPCSSGCVSIKGSVSYASQNPWLFVGSVRQNILFGQAFDKSRYMEVCKVCALERDISLFPHGDKTIIGERGVSLSGGQRARINLARAIYKEADIYLLDDPLSAVDTQVARHIFENCIKRHLQNKTVILVTHQLQFVKNVDNIVIMEFGSILAEGGFDDLNEQGLAIIQLLQDKVREAREDDPMVANQTAASSLSVKRSHWSYWSLMLEDTIDQKPETEVQAMGRVQGSVYKNYFMAETSWPYVFLVLFMFLLAQFFASACDYWISKWSNAEDHLTGDTTMDNLLWAQYGLRRKDFVVIFGVLTIATVIVALIRAIMFFSLCMKSSIKLHDEMFECISLSPMSFFHANPSGRILNRFSKDMGAVDELLPQAMLDCFQIILNLLGVIFVIIITETALLVPITSALIIFYIFRLIYVRTTGAIKRLEGITRSPVFNHVNATILGLPIIRSFGAETLLAQEFDRHQDLHSAAWYLFITCSRAFGYFLDVVCLLFIICVTFSCLMKSDIEGSIVGLIITQSISLTGIFQWGMRQSAEMENQMTSVERVLEYTRLPKESYLMGSPNEKAPDNWPSEGAIKFFDLSVRYTVEGPCVLHNLNFDVLPQQKIGIVGRTGAGKSSIIQALFRLAYIDGTITIDDVDISDIRLDELRQKISIIPQEPVLFSGTLRKNLDPFDDYSDAVLLEALNNVELLSNDDPDSLYRQVSDCGSNFSVGERQLVCLARAIVNNDKILLLDEATANVDAQTDALIQTAIRQHFKSCTVLTVAHRLNTVIDSDKILVLDAGRLMEFDHPHILLQNKKGFFRKMVTDTGPAMTQLLMKLAAENYNARE